MGIEAYPLHPHWVGDHSKCRPGLRACVDQDALIAKRPQMMISTAGAWSVHKGTRVTPDGVDQGTWISDGTAEMFTAEDPAPLVIALMDHLGIERIDPVE